jgi:ADP-ribose pyrophosphatase
MSDRHWTTLSSQVAYTKKWISVREEAVALPDGRVLDPYIIIDIPSFCNVLVVTPADEVVMVKQFRHAAGVETLEMPGGMMEPGEDPALAAAREVLEETGYACPQLEALYDMAPNPPLENNRAWFYVARGAVWQRAPQYDAFEDIQVVHLPRATFLDNLLQGKFNHGTQIGALYAGAVRLGWLKP